MPLTLVGFIVGLILFFFGMKRGQNVLKAVGVLFAVSVIAYWILFFISNRG